MMQAASGGELLLYIVVVAYLQVVVYLKGVALSERTAHVVLHTAGTHVLPVRLTSILSVPPGYLEDARTMAPATGEHWLRTSLRALSTWPRPRDVSDVQWREFRGSMWLLVAALTGFVVISRVAQMWGPRVKVTWYLTSSVVFLGVLHGAQAVWPPLLAAISHLLSGIVAGRSHGAAAIWAWHVAVFVIVRQTDGQLFSLLSPSLQWLEAHRGLLRWHIHYNLLLLRMLSHALDRHWSAFSHTSTQAAPDHREAAPARKLEAKARIEAPLPSQMYRLGLYLAYCFYVPLYIAGPTITYNNFVSQLAAPPRITAGHTVLYVMRWLGAAGMLELMTHTLYFNATAKFKLLITGVLQGQGLEDDPLHYALTGFWVLVFMWLKFLVIWRLFRAAALMDGVDVPENMTRCVCNNYDVEGFWRSWHASYNRWLVRYLYVPLGGSAWRAANVWPIFLFVAAWHDLEPRLLHWGLLMPAVFLPEMVVKALASQPRIVAWSQHWAYRHMAALLATANILGLMCANLAGFVVGIEGVPPLVAQVLGRPRMAISVVAALFCAAHIMFAIRAREARQAAADTAGLSDTRMSKGDRGPVAGGWAGIPSGMRRPAQLQMHKLS